MDEQKPKVSSESAPVPATACQVCGEPLSPGDTVWCETCKTPHHAACWRYNKGCSTFGCRRRFYLAQEPAITASPIEQDPLEPCDFDVMFPEDTCISIVVAPLILSLIVLSLALMPNTIGLIFAGVEFAFISAIATNLRGRVQFSPRTGKIEFRREIFGITLTHNSSWLCISDVAEVFLIPEGALELAMGDGSRVKVTPLTASSTDEKRAVAERAAIALGTTVRVVTGKPPTAEEIRQIGREAKRLRLEEAEADAQEHIEEKPKA